MDVTDQRTASAEPGSSEHLAQLILSTKDSWGPYLELGKVKLDRLLGRIAAVDDKSGESGELADEQIWTFLASVGYAAGGELGVRSFYEIIIGYEPTPLPKDPKIWFEVLPKSPRTKEGATHLDLALGFVQRRDRTSGGIELRGDPRSWACFVEAKWYSDIDTKVSAHPERNQLARVAENAVTFQSRLQVVSRPIVALLTPRRFRESAVLPRLYAYKFAEYHSDPGRLRREWVNVSDRLEQRHESLWKYPRDVDRRLLDLQWAWCAFEDLFSQESLPPSPLRESLSSFERRWNGSRPLGRDS